MNKTDIELFMKVCSLEAAAFVNLSVLILTIFSGNYSKGQDQIMKMVDCIFLPEFKAPRLPLNGYVSYKFCSFIDLTTSVVLLNKNGRYNVSLTERLRTSTFTSFMDFYSTVLPQSSHFDRYARVLYYAMIAASKERRNILK